MPLPTPTSLLSTPSHSTLHNEHVNVKAFGTNVGTGGDDTQAFRDAIAAQQATGGTLVIPASTTADYNITSTIDLSGVTNLHMVGGHKNAGFIQGQMPPAAVIDGTSITTGPVFYSNRGGTGANHRWENLSVYGGRTCFQYLEAGRVEFENVAAYPTVIDGNLRNAAVVMENSFWCSYTRCAFHSPGGISALPSVILLSSNPVVNVGSGAHRFDDTTFWGGSVLAAVNVDLSSIAQFSFTDCTTENSALAMLTFTESGLTANVNVDRIAFRRCLQADTTTSPVPMLHLNASHLTLAGPVFESCFAQANPPQAIKVTAGNVSGAVITGAWGGNAARYVTNAAGSATSGSVISSKVVGHDIIGDDSSFETTSTQFHHAGAALRLGRPGEADMRHAITTTGKHYWGSGSAAYDTTLYRNAADQLKTDDKLIAAAGIGVGNSAAATTPGSVVRKMEVFDASGASLGFVPIYSSIT